MTTYRLPEALGGGEYEGVELPGAYTKGGVYVRLTVEGVGFVTLPLGKVEEVKPPPPPEPAFGEFVATGTDGNLLPIYRRWMDTGWNPVGLARDDFTWAELCAEAQRHAGRWPVRLVPDPFAEPVKLPWELASENGRLLQVTDDDDPEAVPSILVEISDPDQGCLSFWTPTTSARDYARAVWAAADAAEAKS